MRSGEGAVEVLGDLAGAVEVVSEGGGGAAGDAEVADEGAGAGVVAGVVEIEAPGKVDASRFWNPQSGCGRRLFVLAVLWSAWMRGVCMAGRAAAVVFRSGAGDDGCGAWPALRWETAGRISSGACG